MKKPLCLQRLFVGKNVNKAIDFLVNGCV